MPADHSDLLNPEKAHGVPKVPNDEIAIIVSSLRKVATLGIPFVFTDVHAYLRLAQHSTDLQDLNRIDWLLLQRQDFERDNNDLGKTDRYQAEALVWKHLPVQAIAGIVCSTEAVRDNLRGRAVQLGRTMDIVKRSDWYFS